MDKSYRLFWVMIGIAVLPIIINFIARIPFPSGTDVVAGDEGDWVGFFGTYVGALIGAAVTLFVVYREMKHNALNIMIQNQKNQIDELKRGFVESLSSFDFVYLGSEISLIPVDELPNMSDYVLNKLNEKHRNATQIYNSWVILFQGQMSVYEKSYEECLKQYMSDINDVTKKVRELKEQEITKKDFLIWAKKFNNLMVKHKEVYLQPLADASNKVLESEVEKLQRMRVQQSKLIPNIKF